MPSMLGSMIRQLRFKPSPVSNKTRFDGKTAIITGANVGLGLAAAKEMASHGLSRLILGVRTLTKGEQAKKEILKNSSMVDVQVWELDQESYESIQAFAARAQALEELDIVILNAGVKNMEFSRSKTGHESNIQVGENCIPFDLKSDAFKVNVLGPALLSLLLLPLLQQTATKHECKTPTRLTFTSSDVHFWTPFAEKDAPAILTRLDEESSFNAKAAIERYNTSKLVSLLWARELKNKVHASKDIIINFVNPGLCSTSLHRSDKTPGLGLVLKATAWSATQGGHTLVDAVANHTDSPGAYLSEQKVMR